jgi:hypothetical protein
MRWPFSIGVVRPGEVDLTGGDTVDPRPSPLSAAGSPAATAGPAWGLFDDGDPVAAVRAFFEVIVDWLRDTIASPPATPQEGRAALADLFQRLADLLRGDDAEANGVAQAIGPAADAAVDAAAVSAASLPAPMANAKLGAYAAMVASDGDGPMVFSAADRLDDDGAETALRYEPASAAFDPTGPATADTDSGASAPLAHAALESHFARAADGWEGHALRLFNPFAAALDGGPGDFQI